MIRGFSLLCKINFNQYSALDLFYFCMTMFNIHDYPCPSCSAKHPDWKRHARYERSLIGFEKGHPVYHQVTILRYRCLSCHSTHAVLPEFIIPFQSYSLLFILAVMKDYFIGTLTVEAICKKYDISVSTLYAWKALFLKHKKIWLGILQDAVTSPGQFLESLRARANLKEFFHLATISFLQGSSLTKTAHYMLL